MIFKRQLLLQIFLNFIGILLGFFLSITLSTVLGQTGDWVILSAGLLTALLETLSFLIYNLKRKLNSAKNVNKNKAFIPLVNFFNSLKVGILYGFFVESFKLGS